MAPVAAWRARFILGISRLNQRAKLWLFAALAIFSASGAIAGSCSENTIELRQNGVQAEFSIELAIKPEEQAQGLMFRESMPQFNGMLFINERPRQVSFWMKNTLISLDILFIDATGVVKTIKHSATPLDTTAIPGGDDIQYVLEINGGIANLLGLSAGAETRYIGYMQENAIWPCE
ncbi:MAG: DUF192 domain-containing protein [Rhodobacteraceae bacterium]|nr:DUF192 domain-containing protein [Paracoccaceae bacterium]